MSPLSAPWFHDAHDDDKKTTYPSGGVRRAR
jgi:hypothetical protein